jgi:formylglycine-generating enzyme required for sulfatase activity
MKKTQLSKTFPLLLALFLPVGQAVPQIFAQTAPALDIGLYAGLNVTGDVGAIYAIQYTKDLSQITEWRTLTFVKLASPADLWTDTALPANTRRFYRAAPVSAVNLVFIPPGSFRMGSPLNEVDRLDDEGPQTVVTLTKGFLMAKYHVTQGEYLAVVGTNPSYFTTDNGYSLDLSRPVERVSWHDATNYCVLLTKREAAAGRLPQGAQYRLPTEAEYEYACRAWTSDRRLYYGDDRGYSDLTDYEWYEDNSAGMTHPVGQKLPNAWGLHDMAGNASTWCQDWYGPYPGGSVTDPQGALKGSQRVSRGGAWASSADHSRSAARFSFPPDTKLRFGFRIVLAAVP